MEVCQIKDLKYGKENRSLKARIVRLWHVTKQSAQPSSLHMILLDEETNKIQASIFSNDTLTKHINHLHEGRCYEISKFSIGENNGLYKTTKHQYRMTIHYGTIIKACDAPIPYYAFDFVPFETILSETNYNEYLIDAIGVVSEYGMLEDYQHQGHTGKRIEFRLVDERNNTVRVTLFGELAIEIFNFLTENNEVKVVVLQLARITIFKGESSLIPSWNTTKVLMNPDIPEAATFMNMPSNQVSSLTQSTSQFSSESMSSSRNTLSNPTLRRTIMEIKEATQSGRVTTVATIHDIIEDYNWFYQACNKCSKMVKPKKTDSVSNENVLWCDKCEKIPSLVIPRYKIHLRVMDHTSNACFVLFDKEAFNLFHKAAAELRRDLIQMGNEYGFPDILYSLVGQKFVFMIYINQEFNIEKHKDNYTIIKVSNDNDLIQDFVTTSELTQRGNEPDPCHILHLPQHAPLSDNESGSIIGDNETKQSITPILADHKRKKPIINVDSDWTGLTEIPTPQFSTSKSNVRVKIEKPVS